MALTYYFGNIIRGLNADTKPTNVPTGSIFVETDTGDIYALVAGVWVKSNTFVASDIEVYPYSTTIGDYSTPINAYGTEASVTIGTTNATQLDLRPTIATRQGYRITDTTLRQKRFISVSFYLQRYGTISGNASITMRKTSDDSLVGTFGTIDSTTVQTGSFVLFTFTTPVVSPNEDFRILVEYSGGVDNTNKLAVGENTSSTYAGASRSTYNAGYTDDAATECNGAFIYTTEGTTNPATNANDGNTGTRYESISEINPVLKLEMSAAADKEPAALALFMHANTTCTALAIECSTDSVTWVLARTVNVSLLTNGAYNYFRFNRGTQAYRYIRVRGTDAGAKVLAISEAKVLIPTESQFNRRHGHKQISTSDGTVALTA